MRKGGIPYDQLQKTNFYADKGHGSADDDEYDAARNQKVVGSPDRISPGRKKKKKRRRNRES